MYDFTREDIDLRRIRARLHAMSDVRLMAYGRAAAYLVNQPDSRETFRVQLDEARAEWLRRHPKRLNPAG